MQIVEYLIVLSSLVFDAIELICSIALLYVQLWRFLQLHCLLLIALISNALNRGLLVPEDVIFGLLSNTLFEGHYRGESDFIMDGLPQNRFQAVCFGFLCLLCFCFKN